MQIVLRNHSWDRAIFESVVSGEYGKLEFQGKTVVDIGAHIGSFSVLACLGGASRVLAYEAGAENFALLAENCGDLAAAECHHAAVWRSDTEGAVLRWRSSANGENTGGGTVIDCLAKAGEPEAPGDTFEVRAIPLDDIVGGVGHVDLVKIDAEGSEYPILFTSRMLDRISEIVGEYHEIGGLRQSMSIPGFPEWNIRQLATHLARNGFLVTVRDKGPLGLFRAVRNHSPGAGTQAERR